MTVADRRDLTGKPPNLDVAVEADVASSSIGSSNASGGWRRTGPTWHASGRRERGPISRVAAVGREADAAMSWGRFDTRTIVLIPIAIAINIVLGQTVAAVAQGPDLPRFDRDDPGRRAGGADPGSGHRRAGEPHLDLRPARAVPLRLRRAVRDRRRVRSGCSPGIVAQSGFFRSRPNPSWAHDRRRALIVVLVLGGIGYYGFLPFYTGGTSRSSATRRAPRPFFVLLGYLIAIGIIAAIVGLIVLLVRPPRHRRRLRRDRAG